MAWLTTEVDGISACAQKQYNKVYALLKNKATLVGLEN